MNNTLTESFKTVAVFIELKKARQLAKVRTAIFLSHLAIQGLTSQEQ